MQLSVNLKETYCTLIFDNLFNSPTLIDKTLEDIIYVIGTIRSNQK